MVKKRRRKLKLTKESLKRLGANQLVHARGGSNDTMPEETFDTACIDCVTIWDDSAGYELCV